MYGLLFVTALAASQGQGQGQDTLPRITLAEAITRATRVDPEYVRATGQVHTAAWGRRAAVATFALPSVGAVVDATKYSTEFFNIGTGQLQSQAVNAQVTAQYDLFSLRKFSELGRSRAELESAEAGEQQQRFRTALATETDYYDVLRNQELGRVAAERMVGSPGTELEFAL